MWGMTPSPRRDGAKESLSDAEPSRIVGLVLRTATFWSLSGRGDDAQKNGRQVIAARRVEDGTPIIVVKKDEITPKVEVVDDTKPAPQLLPASAPVVDLPAGPEPGDVLRVNTDFGVVHVLVPDGVSEGARLELGGVVEVAVPPERRAGDVVGVALPDGTVVSVEVLAEDVGAAISVAFPVVVLDSSHV